MSQTQLKDRLIEARIDSGYEQPAAVAKLAKITPSALYQLEEGKTKSLKAETAGKLARIYKNYRIEWLVSGIEPKYNQNQSSKELERIDDYGQSGYIRLRVMEAFASAGYGSVNDDFPEVLRSIDIAEWQVRQQLGFIPTDNRVQLLTVRGNSNYPKIKNGDVVMVDTSQTAYAGDDFYLINLHGFTLVKRLQIMGDGLHIRSTNPEYDSEVVPAKMMADLIIAGRILGLAQFRRSEEI